MTAYLNQNFYGNQSYGVKAAAPDVLQQGPQGPHPRPRTPSSPRSPSRRRAYDLVKQRRRGAARRRSRTAPTARQRQAQLVVARHSDDLQAPQLRARADEDPQPAVRRQAHAPTSTRPRRTSRSSSRRSSATSWQAPHFVWQVRQQLGAILCPEVPADQCDKIDTGGYQVTTTLDWKMQATVEKWLYAAAGRPEPPRAPATSSANLKIPRKPTGAG